MSGQNGLGIPPGTGNRALDNTKLCPPQADKQNLHGMRKGGGWVVFKRKIKPL